MAENYTTKRKLVDILDGDADSIRKEWDETEAAQDFAPLPPGVYVARVQSVELFNAKTGTAGVKVTFRVADGDHVGRALWHDLWLTPAALPQTKRDCLKLGLDSIDALENATIPPGRVCCKVLVALRRNDEGVEYNRVRRFDVLGIDEPADDPFAPDETSEPNANSPKAEAAPFDAVRPSGVASNSGDTDTSFGFGAHTNVADASAATGGGS